MIYFILYMVSVLVAIPIIGRFFARYLAEPKPGQLSNTTGGIFYGIMWPLFTLILLGFWIKNSGIIRRYVTGERNDS